MRVRQAETLMTWGEMLRWGLAQGRGPSPGLGVLGDWPLNNGQELTRQRRMWEQGEQRVQRSLQTTEASGGTLGRDETGEGDCALSKDLRPYLKAMGCHRVALSKGVKLLGLSTKYHPSSRGHGTSLGKLTSLGGFSGHPEGRDMEEFKGEWTGLGNCLQNSQVGCP